MASRYEELLHDPKTLRGRVDVRDMTEEVKVTKHVVCTHPSTRMYHYTERARDRGAGGYLLMEYCTVVPD